MNKRTKTAASVRVLVMRLHDDGSLDVGWQDMPSAEYLKIPKTSLRKQLAEISKLVDEWKTDMRLIAPKPKRRKP